MAIIIDGKRVAEELKLKIELEVKELTKNGSRPPHLVAILVGNNGASETYVANKVKSCEELGFNSTLLRFETSISEEDLLKEVDKINENTGMDGLIVQLPLPNHINPDKIMERIDPKKDVDGFHPINIGRMAKGLPGFISATPQGIIELLDYYKIETSGKHCVVVGRSQIVGLPMAILMQRNHPQGNATVTLTHSKTKNLAEICSTADILIAALGKPEMITSEYIKKGAVVFDVGLTRIEDKSKKSGFSLKGDVKLEDVLNKVSYITPVPKGVGPMTIVSLMKNTLISRKGLI